MREEIKRKRRLDKLRKSVAIREAQMVLDSERSLGNSNPEFKEGPFFYISRSVLGQPNKGFIVWATDAQTARSVFGMKTSLSIAYIYPELIGTLADVKTDYRLSPSQVSDLHREGYLKL